MWWFPFRFPRSLQTIFYNSSTSLHSSQQCARTPLSSHLHQTWLSFGSLRVLILIDGERFLPLGLISIFLVSSGGNLLIVLSTICMNGRKGRWPCPLSNAPKFLADHYWLLGGIFPNKWQSWLFCLSLFSSSYAFQILMVPKVSDLADSICAVSYINTPSPTLLIVPCTRSDDR